MRRIVLAALVVIGTLAVPGTADAATCGTLSGIPLRPKMAVQCGIGSQQLARGPSRVMGSHPIWIAGHNVTPVRPWPHGPFYYLSSLKPGMHVWYNGKRMRVLVSKAVPQWQVGGFIARYRYNDLALTTCWPRYSATYRWVVIAR
jgi:sortase (surface protein transpeptidase)